MLVDTGVSIYIYIYIPWVYPLSAQLFLVTYLARFAEPILFETDSSITEETRIPLLGGLNLTLDGTTKFRDMFFSCAKV